MKARPIKKRNGGIPEGYYYLPLGAVLESGDLYWYIAFGKKIWRPTDLIGEKVENDNVYVRKF